MLGALCLASLALALCYGVVPAIALQATGTAPDLVAGVVVSARPHVVPQTGVILTDMQVLATLHGETTLTAFTMRGGEVGKVGMWSEQFADVRVGDSVVAGVAENNGQATVIAAPRTGRSVSGSVPLGADTAAAGVLAGYLYDGHHWAPGNLPVRYYVNPAGMPAGAASAISNAAQTWEDDPGSDMDYTYMGVTSASPSSNDNKNVIGAADLGPTNTGTIALCTIWYSTSTNLISQFDIQYNTAQFAFSTTGSSSAFDVQGIGTHELGHTLQLLDLYDSGNSNQVMYGYGGRGITHQRTLAWGDIAGIRAIYPAVLGTLSGTVTSSGAPLPAVSVSVPGHASATTTSNGTYSIGDVVAGTYDVMFSLAGYKTQILRVTIPAGSTTTRDASLVPGADSDDDIPGVAAPSSPITGTLDAGSDVHDVYRLYLTVGQTLAIDLHNGTGIDFDVSAFGTGAHSILTDVPRADATGTAQSKSLRYVVPFSGYYYIDAHATSGSGSYSLAYSVAPATPMPVYRFYNMRNGSHFYTASAAEKANVLSTLYATYSLDGVAYSVNTADPANGAPLYRFFNKKNGSHFYTASEVEKASVLKNLYKTYSYDGPAYNVCLTAPEGAATVWRFYNMRNGSHFYTASDAEKASVMKNLSATYRLDGPAFFIAP